MRTARRRILEWAEQGALPEQSVEAALKVAGVTPDADDWRRFIAALLLWLGAVLIAAGVIFFFAYNWDAMGRLLKFGLVEGTLVAAIVVASYIGPDRAVGKASVLLAALLTGALLALIGQTYQTGADAYQLFAWWALLILPWTAVARLPALWLLLLALLNLTVGMYFQTFRGIIGVMFSDGTLVWALVGLNTTALAAWELTASRGLEWMQGRWAPRLIAAASGIAITVLGLWAIFESGDVGPFAFPAYGLWLAGAYFVYRRQVRDLFVLAGGVLSVIVFVAAFVTHQLFRRSDDATFLLVGVLIIVMSAAGAWWLKRIGAEDEA